VSGHGDLSSLAAARQKSGTSVEAALKLPGPGRLLDAGVPARTRSVSIPGVVEGGEMMGEWRPASPSSSFPRVSRHRTPLRVSTVGAVARWWPRGAGRHRDADRRFGAARCRRPVENGAPLSNPWHMDGELDEIHAPARRRV